MRPTSLLLLLASGCGGGTTPSPDGGPSGCLAGQEKFGEVCVTAPTMAAARTQCGDVYEYCDRTGKSGPNLECLTTGPKMHPPTPAKVTLTGFVHPFSGGNSNAEVTIQIFKAADLVGGADPASAPQVVPQTAVTFEAGKATDPKLYRACDRDSKVGCIATRPDDCKVVCEDGIGGRDDAKRYCRGPNDCRDRLRWEPRFSIPDVPTNTSLVIRASGANGMKDNTWAVLVTWNVFLASDERDCPDALATDCIDRTDPKNPKYQLNVNVLSQADYYLIPMAAGLSGGIAPGQGAVAGEVHDCDNVRVGNVQVGVKPTGDRFSYFNGQPFDTLPDSSRAATGTDRLGLYASMNVKPGPVTVEAVGLVGGNKVSVGKFSAWLQPNTVTVLAINGGKPAQ